MVKAYLYLAKMARRMEIDDQTIKEEEVDNDYKALVEQKKAKEVDQLATCKEIDTEENISPSIEVCKALEVTTFENDPEQLACENLAMELR